MHKISANETAMAMGKRLGSFMSTCNVGKMACPPYAKRMTPYAAKIELKDASLGFV